MNAGLSSLTKLKSAVLVTALRTRIDWDDALRDLGLGIAEAIETYLDRKLAFVAGDTVECDAQRIIISVPRYPVSVFTAVEMQTTPTGSWEDISGSVTRYERKSGIYYFRSAPGDDSGTIRTTYSGGFWWDTDEEGRGSITSGAVPLPAALFTAWSTQVMAAAVALDLFGAQANGPTVLGSQSSLIMNAEGFTPAVKALLAPFRRMAA